MKKDFFLKYGVLIAGLLALSSVILISYFSVLSYRAEKRLVSQWAEYMRTEDQLYVLREDANRLYEIEHSLGGGSVQLFDEFKQAGSELLRIPSLADDSKRRMALLNKAGLLQRQGHEAASLKIIHGRELAQVTQDLMEELFQYQLNERARLREKFGDHLMDQQHTNDLEIVGVLLAVLMVISSSAFFYLYLLRVRRSDRDLLQARQEAERASKLKSSFLANMSHEIRTPLNGVLGLSRLLRETSLTADQDEIVSSLEASGRTLQVLVNDILDLSKIESGKIEILQEPFDLGEVLTDLRKSFLPLAQRKKLSLVFDAPESPFGMIGDMVKLRQILQNLVSNAIKFTAQGEVRLTARVAGEKLKIEVRDTGIGISSEAMKRLFHPFEQADSSTSRIHGGSGLGLAICRHLVTQMGGQVGVESQERLGSVFWFEVPYRAAILPAFNAKDRAEERAPKIQQWHAEKCNDVQILVVEDNEVNSHLVASFLRRRGFLVEIAEDGEKAIHMARERQFHLILMDIQLPRKDGLETTRDIRAGSAGPLNLKTPIIALTASAIKGERERCLEAGMNDFLTKPVDLDEMEAAIRRFVAVENPRQSLPETVRRVPSLDPELRSELMTIFRRVTPTRLLEFHEAVGQSDWKRAGRLAHTMKSSAAQLGFVEMADLCQQIENKGNSGVTDSWLEDSKELTRLCQSAVAEDFRA